MRRGSCGAWVLLDCTVTQHPSGQEWQKCRRVELGDRLGRDKKARRISAKDGKSSGIRILVIQIP